VNHSTWIKLSVAVVGCLLNLGVQGAGRPATQEPELFARTIYLVRHGAYDALDKTDSPDGAGLTPLGIAQARLIGARLRGLPSSITSVTTSTMTRARETASVIHESLPEVAVQDSSILRECTPPMRAEEKRDERAAKEERDCQITLDQAFARYFTPARDPEQNDVLVCHGNAIRYFVMRALGVDTRSWIGIAVGHASLTVIRVRATGAMTVLSVGDVGHLAPNLQS
jgi:serine/threonine-protein phosphatase PGAM5